jgi:hypothetical protein
MLVLSSSEFDPYATPNLGKCRGRLSAISHSPPGRKVLVSAPAHGVALMFWGRLNAKARVHHAYRWRFSRVASRRAGAACGITAYRGLARRFVT